MTSVAATPPRAHTSQSRIPRLSSRTPSARAPGSSEASRVGTSDDMLLTVNVSVRCSRVLYSSRSITGSRRRTAALERADMSMKRARNGSAPSVAGRSTRMSRCAIASASGPDTPSRSSAETDEIGVGVEDHHRQRGLDDESLQHDPQRVRLPGAALPTPERVTIEPVRQQP